MIENNPISSLSSKPADDIQPADKKMRMIEQQPLEKKQDKVELSEKAKLLSKATATLNDPSEIEEERIAQITQQVQDGTYKVPVSKLASILLERFYTI
ncbi:MAG: flagellar biosynthesis anti-sigma factor FlgM [Anaerolineaceae bacterium]